MSLDPTDWNKRMDPNFGTNWRAKTTRGHGRESSGWFHKIPEFHLISWFRNFVDSFGRFARNYAETVPFHNFNTKK